MPRLSPDRMAILKKSAADFAAQHPLVPFNDVMNRFYREKGITFAQSWMSNAIKQHHNVSFAELQRRARLEFIVKNSGKSNDWLAKKLGISKSSLCELTRILKEEGALRRSKRYAESKRAQNAKLPLAYCDSAHSIMRFLSLAPTERGLSVPELARVLDAKAVTVRRSVALMREQGFLTKTGKNGQWTYYVPSKKSEGWLREINKMRRERDGLLIKTNSISSVITRKEKERTRLVNAITFARMEGVQLEVSRVYDLVREIDAEISRLNSVQLKRKKI